MVSYSAAIPWLIFRAAGVVRASMNSPGNWLSTGTIYFALSLYFHHESCYWKICPILKSGHFLIRPYMHPPKLLQNNLYSHSFCTFLCVSPGSIALLFIVLPCIFPVFCGIEDHRAIVCLHKKYGNSLLFKNRKRQNGYCPVLSYLPVHAWELLKNCNPQVGNLSLFIYS